MKTCVALLVSLGLGLCCAPNANAQSTCPAPTTGGPFNNGAPAMTIIITNNDPSNRVIFPVLTTGGAQATDLWLQAWFCNNSLGPFTTSKLSRIYINASTGIAPNQSVTLQLPLYTTVVGQGGSGRPLPDKYIDWWNGDTIELFFSATGSTAAPTELTQLVNATTNSRNNPDQKALANQTGLPTCVGNSGNACTLQFFVDTASIAKSNPSQLVEFTLGAIQSCAGHASDPACINRTVPNALDTMNVDIDMSYVNVAFGPATLAPYQNDQTGYIGTPQSADTFSTALQSFLASSKCQTTGTTSCNGWPQFVHTFNDKTTDLLNKLASPLEVFTRFNIPTFTAPSDLCGFTTANPPMPDCVSGVKNLKWTTSNNNTVADVTLWPPIQVLLENWVSHAGTLSPSGSFTGYPDPTNPQSTYDPTTGVVTTSGGENTTLPKGSCGLNPAAGTFCAAIMDIKALIIRNYNNYVSIATANRCSPIVPLTDFTAIGHIYGWTPFTEFCLPAAVNLLQETPFTAGGIASCTTAAASTPICYSGPFQGTPPVKTYQAYQQVKTEFDDLNNNNQALTGGDYNFNPWVNVLIHGPFVNAQNVYAYSVDDAVGNLQAAGQGFFIDVGSSQNLCTCLLNKTNPCSGTPGPTPACPNQNPAVAPINVTVAQNPSSSTNFTHYGLCKYDPSDTISYKTVNRLSSAFIMSPSNPQQCPIFFDNRPVGNQTGGQLYTFTVVTSPSSLPPHPPPFTPCTEPNTVPRPVGCQVDQMTAQDINCRAKISSTNGSSTCGGSMQPSCVTANSPNTSINGATFGQSSAPWCCVVNVLPSINGVWAQSKILPFGAGKNKAAWQHNVITNVDAGNTSTNICSMGQPVTP
jgi:hypothetical protein